MKQRFLNQKLGKRNARRTDLQKAKNAIKNPKHTSAPGMTRRPE
jgi:hypothetical protein